MKTLIALLVAAGVGFGAAFIYVSNQKDAALRSQREALEAQAKAERDKLEKDLKVAKGRPARVEQITTTTTVEVPVALKVAPKEILDRLVKLKPAGDATRYQNIRKIVHQLESLADLGAEALPAIRDFLALNQDVAYEQARADSTPGGPPGAGGDNRPRFGGGSPWANQLPSTDFIYPHSLRLGLAGVLRDIGGTQAEAILLEVLATTGRGVEVAVGAKYLDELTPGKHKDASVRSAIELLSNLPVIEHPTRDDDLSASYLYAVLNKFKDTSFAATAQTKLVGADGKVDRAALGYLTSTLAEQALPGIYQAYQDARITNGMERATLFAASLNFVGQNPTANAMFKDVIANDTSNWGKFMAVGALAGGEFGPTRRESPTDPQVIRGRMELLAQLPAATLQDERFAGMVDRTKQNLQNLLDGKPIDTSFGRGGTTGRGPRGPGQ